MFGKMFALRNSMLGQMALLTAIFLGWGIYTFVVLPVLDIPATPPQPANKATGMQVQDAIRTFMVSRLDGSGPVRDLAEDPVIRAVAARNPAFGYYIRIGDRTWGSGPAVYFTGLHFDRIEQVHRSLPELGICTTTNKVIEPDHSTGFVEFTMCDTLTYFEYHGLTTPVIANPDDLTPLYKKWFWSFSNNFLFAAVGVFLIFAIILCVQMLLIRRVARLAGSFDPERLDRKLPETGLATEILPLVRAVNHMLDQVKGAQQRNRFFLSAAAHEMRTPLTVLRTRMELLDSGPMKDKLIGDVRRLMTLVSQLLALMSIGNRHEILDFIDLADCCRKAVIDVAPLATERDVTVTVAALPAPYEIEGDGTLILSAISNLIANAISVSPQGAQVLVSLDEAGQVAVRDFGPGITQPDPAVLFEPFVRHPPTRKGHGLGLAIVKAVAALHDGRVSASNAHGGGAIFTISFALLAED